MISSAENSSSRRRSGFLASVLTLLSGAMLAQVVNLLSIPALTRCYLPADFASFTLMAATVTVVMSFATGRYEFALMVCEEELQRARVMVLAMFLATITSILVGALGLGLWLLQISWLPIPVSWVVLTPTIVMACGIASVCNQYQIATGQFRRVAFAEVSMVVVVAASQLAFGLLWYASGTTLIAGMLIGRLVSLLIVSQGVSPFLWRNLDAIGRTSVWQTAKHFKRFPTYTTLFELVAAASNELPSFVLRIAFPPQALGFFALSMRVLEKPVQLVNASLSPVVLRQVSQLRQHNHDVNQLMLKVSGLLFALICPASMVLWYYSEGIFSYVFGPQWAAAGGYARLLIPLLAVRFATLPCWTGLIGRGRPQLMLVWTAVHFLTTGLAMFALVPSESPEKVVLAFSTAGAITHLLLLGINFTIRDSAQTRDAAVARETVTAQVA